MYIRWNLIEMELREKKISFKECAKMLGIGTVTFNRYRTSVSDISVKLMYELLKIVELENVDISNFVKVLLPKKEEHCRKILTDGFTYEGCNYKYFITSPSLLKKNHGQALFINKEVYDFKAKFEDIVSLNKLGEMKDKNYLNINKDIISRVSLAMSSSTVVDISNFKILVLPEYEYKYLQLWVCIGVDI